MHTGPIRSYSCRTMASSDLRPPHPTIGGQTNPQYRLLPPLHLHARPARSTTGIASSAILAVWVATILASR